MNQSLLAYDHQFNQLQSFKLFIKKTFQLNIKVNY